VASFDATHMCRKRSIGKRRKVKAQRVFQILERIYPPNPVKYGQCYYFM
jgi:hypothetical protein